MLEINTFASERRVGANPLPDGRWEFLLWAPNARRVSVYLIERNELIDMEPMAGGYHRAVATGLKPGCRYFYRLDANRDLPDPMSRFQPEGVHGPSQLVNLGAFRWTDDEWTGRTLESSVIYELHVGTYTCEGSFDAVIAHLPELVTLGVTTIELMPIAQFPGLRNWGYDGVCLFAPQNSYGGPEGLYRLVDAAHRHGICVALDVVYNHLGPEGNYLNAFGPYFTDRYRTPWGPAVNLDDAGSDEVRRFFIENALYWLEDYHFDILRLDAIHGMFDFGARHFLAELQSAVAESSRRLGRKVHLIAESDLNDTRILRPSSEGGYGLAAQWSDDFHHSVHSLLTKENRGYYADFEGISPLAVSLRDGWYYSGQYSRSRKRSHGNAPVGLSSSHFVVFSQNHDQVGNRAEGERLSTLVSLEAHKLAAGITLLSPFVPMLFMGEEYGETAPFQYFTSHEDQALAEAVRRGRQAEFSSFSWNEKVSDPQDQQTFSRSKLNHKLKEQEPHRTLLRFYEELLRIRADLELGKETPRKVCEAGDNALLLLRETVAHQIAMIFNFAESATTVTFPELAGDWTTIIRSSDRLWGGPESGTGPALSLSSANELQLSPTSFLVMERTQSGTETA